MRESNCCFKALGTLSCLVVVFSTCALGESHRIFVKNAARDGGYSLLAVAFDEICTEVESIRSITDEENFLPGQFAVRGDKLFYQTCQRLPPKYGSQRYRSFLSDTINGASRAELTAVSALETDIGGVGQPSFSNDGRKLAFTLPKRVQHPEEGVAVESLAIYTYDIEKGKVEEIVPFGDYCQRPVFSPDDRWIAFYRAPLDIVLWGGDCSRRDTYGHQLCVVPSGGGEVRVLSPALSSVSMERPAPPSWSPDGKRILFMGLYVEPDADDNQAKTIGIYMVDSEGGDIEPLTPDTKETPASCPSWSPDGTRMAYLQAGEVRVMDINTRESRVVVSGAKGRYRCKWAPEGELIAYNEREGLVDYLCVTSADGMRQLRRLATINSWSLAFEWAR